MHDAASAISDRREPCKKFFAGLELKRDAAHLTGIMSTDAAYPADVDRCHALLAQQSVTLEAQNSTITQLARELDQLKHFVALLTRQRFGPRSEKLDPSQLSLFDEPEIAAAASATPAAPSETVVREHRRRGGGRNSLPDHLPREIVEHDLSPAEKLCPGCGHERQRIGSDTSEQLEFIPAALKVIEHVRHKYACRQCQEHVARAPLPPQPIDKGLPGPGLLATLIVGKYSDHLPLYRLEDVFARHGVELPRSTLCRWAAQVAELLAPLYQLLAQRVRASKNIHTDDTPVSVLDPNLPHCRTGRFWVYVGDEANPYTVYDYTARRKRDGPVKFLGDFQGYLQADAFAGYDGIYTAGQVQQVLCWAHARRKFYEARTNQPEPAHAALGFIVRLYAVERAAKELAQREAWNLCDAAQREHWHASRGELRQSQALPVLAEFRAWLESAQRDVLPKSPVGQAIRYVLPRWDGLTRYCQDGALAIDNNVAERTVRLCAIGRKNWTFLGSDNGGRTAAILFSFTATCKANAVEPFAYLRDLLTQLPSLPAGADLSPLLPDRWLATHPEAHREWSR